MSYKALYRVFRPRTFDEVVGQKHIVSVLKSQVMSMQISHAYLFTGSRGTGKTSIAKIFARAISCPNSSEGEACLKCQLCQDAFNDTSMDIVEIDAASNNGVDEIRELRENVKYAPVTGRYKVYIIDEVHMLSGGAFNALLKTLEEPPEHAVFILATTEPQKLPETIISRCQRYDFERIGKEDIAARLDYICAKVGAEAEKDALFAIADFAKGGLRDAISLLDQCIVFGDGKVNESTVLELLGKSESSELFKIADMLIKKDGSGAVIYINSIIRKGKNPSVLAGDIIDHLRKLMIFKTAKDPLDIVDSAYKSDYEKQCKDADINMLLRGIKVLSASMAEMRYAFSPIVILEVALMDICTPSASDDNLAVLQRLSELEKAIREGVRAVAGKAENKECEKTEMFAVTDEEAVPWDTEAYDSIPDAPLEDEGAFIMDEPVYENDVQEPVLEEKEETGEINSLQPVVNNEFTNKDYEAFLKKMNKANKGVYISLKDSFFGGFENGELIIGYPDESCGVFMKAAQAKKSEIIKTLEDLGFKDCKVCVKILKQDKTDALKEMFGDDIKFID